MRVWVRYKAFQGSFELGEAWTVMESTTPLWSDEDFLSLQEALVAAYNNENGTQADSTYILTWTPLGEFPIQEPPA